MANPTGFDPFSDSFEEAFRRIFGPSRGEAQSAPVDIGVDVHDDETAHAVKAEIPGVKESDASRTAASDPPRHAAGEPRPPDRRGARHR